MNKNKIIIIGGASLGVFLTSLIGVGFYGYQRIKNIDENIIHNIDLAIRKLPPSIKAYHTLETNLFESNGKLEFVLNHNGTSETAQIDYTTNHPFTSWFADTQTFNGNININSPTFSKINITPGLDSNIIKFTGNFTTEGDVKVNFKTPTITHTSQNKEKIVINPSKGKLIYSSADNHVSFDILFPQIKSTELKFDFKNLSLVRNFNLKNPELGELSVSSEQISSPLFSLKTFKVSSQADLQKNKINAKTIFEIDGFSVLNEKNLSFTFNSSITNLDSKFLNLYKDILTEKIKPNKEELTQLIQNNIKETVKSGFNFNIDKFQFKNTNNDIKINTNIIVNPSKDDENISLLKNTQIESSIVINSPFSSTISQQILPDALAVIKPTEKTFYANINYSHDNLTINEQNLSDKETHEVFRNILKIFDEHLIEIKHSDNLKN